MSSSPPKQPPRSTNPRSGQNAFPQPLQVVRRSPTSAGNADAAPAAAAGSQYANNFNRNADAKFSTGRRETAASSRYGGFDPADYGSIPSPPPLNPNLNRQRSRREQDEEEWEREQRQRKNSKNDDDFDEEVPRNDLPRPGASARRAAPQQERGRPGGPQRTRSGTAGSSSSYNNNNNSNANTNTNSSANNADDERDRQRERIHINIDGNGTTWTAWGNDGQQRSGNFSFSGTAFGGSPFGGGGGRNNSRLGAVNLPVNLPINIPGFGGFGF